MGGSYSVKIPLAPSMVRHVRAISNACLTLFSLPADVLEAQASRVLEAYDVNKPALSRRQAAGSRGRTR